MSKELTPLKALEKAKMDMDYHRKYECHYYYPKNEREEYFSIIETALKDYEKIDNIISISKETIEFNIQEPEMEVKENGEISLLSRVEMSLRKQLNEKERELFREWVLKECFPEELKALQIIINKGVAVGFIQLLIKEKCGGLTEYNDFIGDKKLYLTQEEFDLLKEVLL